MTATVIVVPVVLLAMLLVVQYGLAYYARQVVAGAAHDGAAAAARERSNPAQGRRWLSSSSAKPAGPCSTPTRRPRHDGDTVTVTATGEVVSLLPFFGTITVTATGSANVERFEPQGASP